MLAAHTVLAKFNIVGGDVILMYLTTLLAVAIAGLLPWTGMTLFNNSRFARKLEKAAYDFTQDVKVLQARV
jgi:hypothetical protein